ncbi:hypothetical protein ES705_12627 [subsurface metagenome]
MEKKSEQNKTIAVEIIEEIDNQIKYGLNLKEFNKVFHKIVTISIEEQLE